MDTGRRSSIEISLTCRPVRGLTSGGKLSGPTTMSDNMGVNVGIGLSVGIGVMVGWVVSVATGAVVGASVTLVGVAMSASFNASVSPCGGVLNEHALVTITSKRIVIQRLNISLFSRMP